MARVGKFLHDSANTTSVTCAVGSYNTTSRHTHTMSAASFTPTSALVGVVNGIHIRLTSATGATKVTVRLCLDEDGDYTVVPDTEATLVAGVTTSTTMCAAIDVGIPVAQILGGRSLYLFVYADAGTPSLAQSCITWQE